MLIQLNPLIPVETPKGKGHAAFLIDYSQEHDLLWVTFLDESGECWTFSNPEIRAQKNFTMGRRTLSAVAPVELTEETAPANVIPLRRGTFALPGLTRDENGDGPRSA